MKFIVIIYNDNMGNRQVLPKITKEEIVEMIDNGKIVFFVGKKVIDATNYVGEHPAGVECLMKRVGMDCKEDYNFHSVGGMKLWNKMVIGYLKEN